MSALPPLALALSLLPCHLAPASPAAVAWQRHVIDNTSRGADGARIADLDGDGLPDVVTPWEEGGLVRIYLHPGHDAVRAPWPHQTVGQVASPEDAVAVDLDADGHPDVVSSSEGRTRQVHAHWNPATSPAGGWSTAPFPATAGRQWMFCLPLQVDGRRGVDLVLGAKGAGAELGWLESPEDPRDLSAWRWHAWTKASWIMSLIALDVDADGHLDVVASDRKPPTARLLWMKNPGQPGAPWQGHPIGGDGEELMFLDAAGPSFRRVPGLDHDLIAVAAKDRQILLFHRPADPTSLWPQTRLTYDEATTGRAKAVAIGDLDADGTPDLVVSCEGANDARCGVFALHSPPLTPDAAPPAHPLIPLPIGGEPGIKFDLIQLVDLTGNGLPDILTCEESQNATGLGLIWYENPTVASP